MDGRVRIVAITLTLLLALASVGWARMNLVMLGGGVVAMSQCAGGTTDYVGNTATSSNALTIGVDGMYAFKRTPACSAGCASSSTLVGNLYHKDTANGEAKICVYSGGDSTPGTNSELIGCGAVDPAFDVGYAQTEISGTIECDKDYWIVLIGGSVAYGNVYTSISGQITYTQTASGAYNSPPSNLGGTWGQLTTGRTPSAYISLE